MSNRARKNLQRNMHQISLLCLSGGDGIRRITTKTNIQLNQRRPDPIWEQPEWEKPVYDHPDGWTPEPPQDKPDYPPMHYKPWEPQPEQQPYHEVKPHQHHEHDHAHYVPPHHHDVPPHVHSVPEYPEPQDPNNININIDINNSSNSNANSNAQANASAASVAKAIAGSLTFAASHSHYGEHDQYHEDCDDLFDWSEATYKDVMPTHKDSYAIEDYYARIMTMVRPLVRKTEISIIMMEKRSILWAQLMRLLVGPALK